MIIIHLKGYDDEVTKLEVQVHLNANRTILIVLHFSNSFFWGVISSLK